MQMGNLCRGLLAAALKAKGLSGGEGCFELSVGNPDKGLMSLQEAKSRVAQFVTAGLPLVVTQVRCSRVRCSREYITHPCNLMLREPKTLHLFQHVQNLCNIR